jgi:hypothetical protein
MNRTTSFLCMLALAGAIPGCLPKTGGEIGNGGFTYYCASDADLTCTYDLLGASTVPPAIAVGAHFELEFTEDFWSDGSQPTVTSVVPAAPSMLSVEPGSTPDATGFRFKEPGTVAVLARGGGEVIDFIHVTGAALADVEIVDSLGDSANAVTVNGYSQKVRALPRDEMANTLAGALSYAWTSSDESIVSVAAGSTPNEASLEPVGNGQATVTVQVQGKQRSIVVTVGGQP